MQRIKHKLNRFLSKASLSIFGFFVLFNIVAIAPAFAASPCDRKVPTSTSLRNCLNENPIIKNLRIVVNFMSAGVGIIIIGSLIVGGIQYTMAGNNPNAVSAAKQRIQDTIIALLTFFFIVAFLQWIIPGGLLNGII